ncbi:MAG: hypothetical protein IPQ13_07110 [Holophagaceae bacterium]|nr:hypothetical protein [Holophagaceae bacterium]
MRQLALLVALLGSGLACERTAPETLYAPAEAGLTLAYENPSLPQPRRGQERMQVRIAKVEKEDAKLFVTKTFTTFEGQMDVLFCCENGGVDLMKDPKTKALVVLPPHFPDVQAWEERGRRHRVEGRAAMPETGLALPDTLGRVGVWVASETLDGKGPRRRTFYLPRLGEIETQEFQEGRWIVVNRLFSYGFSDLPISPSRQNKN